MYEFLQKLFAEGEAVTWEQLKAKIEADKSLKLVNISDGGYVSKEKLDAKISELAGVRRQLEAASAEIQSYKDMDIDGIKQKAEQWEQRYTADTAALQQKLDEQETEFAARTYLGGFKYANDLVRDAIHARFMAKGFKRDGDKFLGADEFMAEMQKAYPTGFLTDAPSGEGGEQEKGNPTTQNSQAQATPPMGAQGNQAPKRPWFAPQVPPATQARRKSLSELMKFKNDHPDAAISYDE